ncbi:MAG TPA: rhomboid family intramembrane serine protease [Fibrobacteraceae bacterium]|nr:rhomboid family intramembrane serine protease [Fibrobacteraceae bacterium]
MLGLTPFRMLPRPVQVLLIMNLAVFLPAVFFALVRADSLLSLYSLLMLVPELYLQIWRFLTYAFVHIDPLHFLFNMLMLWMFGDEVARWMGERQFTVLYLVSAIGAGIFSVPFYATHLIGGGVHILGASGALFGVMVAYGWLFPDRRMLLFFVLPIRARTAVILFAAVDLMMANSGDGIAHFTHLGGALTGLLFMAAYTGKIPCPWKRWVWNRRKSQYTSSSSSRPLQGEIGYFDEQKQLDAVLDKIRRQGMGSLSPDEMRFLRETSEKVRLRRGE